MKIVVILPTYNEKRNMEKMIPVLEENVFPHIKHHSMQILVADDQSPDGTEEVVRHFIKKYSNIHVLTGDKQGLGAAYVRAMLYAMDTLNADAVIEFDADFQHDPHDIPRLINAMDQGADCVIGSRYIPGGAIPKEWGLHRKLLSFVAGSIFTRLVWWNFSVHDMTSGFKLTKTSYLKQVDLEHLYSKYYAYKLHILHDLLKLNAKITEIPIIFYERTRGSSKITSKDLFDSFSVVVRLRIDDFKRVIKFLFVGGTGFIFQYIVTYLTIIGGVEQFIAAMIGGEVAILSNFFFNNIWTFKDTEQVKEKGSVLWRLVKFNIASLASVGVQGLASFLAVKLWGDTMAIFGYTFHTTLIILFPTIIFLVIPMNYFIYNKIIWKTQYLKK
jgi:dolichol-phosphate mannosyltransferase